MSRVASLLPWAVGLAALVADQVTKHVIVAAAGNQPEWSVDVLPPVLQFIYVRNTGVAFSLFQHQAVLTVLILAVIVGVVVTFQRYLPRDVPLLRVSMGMILGGALSNLLDRFRLGYVVDFIAAHLGQHYWPMFNVADSCIVVGVGVLAVYLTLRGDGARQAA